MKKITSAGLVALALCFGFACDGNRTDSVEQAEEINEERFDDTEMEDRKEDQSEFMVKAASSGMMEVELSKLAQQKATSQEVKDFAKQMVDEHSKANQDLKNLAASKNIVLPDSMSNDHRDKMKDVREKTGRDFDKAYMSAMVDEHDDDINLFEKAANNIEDADIRAWASGLLPTLKAHHEKAKTLKDKTDNAN